MSEPLSRLANDAKCLCSNNDALRFRRFHDREEDELLGLQCVKCGNEYLKEPFVPLKYRKAHILQPSRKYRFYLAKSRVNIPKNDLAHMVHSAKTKIDKVECFVDYLKPGDHIAWKRPWGNWHHAIVTDMNTVNSNTICVVHWHSHLGKNSYIKIKEEWIELTKEKGSLYRMDYTEDIVEANPARLVIARARSRIDERGYHLVTDNCETLASFCKFGFAISQQIFWACKELKNECKKSGAKTLAKVGFAEFMETVGKQEQLFGLTLVVVLESVHTCVDIKDLWKARKNGKMTKKVVVEQIVERLTQAVFSGGLASLGSIVPYVGIILGFCGGIAGKWIGSMSGPHLGQFIASLIEYDDRAICKITDLRSGDHLVLEYNNEGSHHCIALSYKEETNQINVIRNTKKDGVIEEWIDFVPPVYKVIYEEEDGPTPDEVRTKAVDKLGIKQYDEESFNSMHFAQFCSKKQK